MSRSTKQPWLKDKGNSRLYWRNIRRSWNNIINKIPSNIDVTFFQYDRDVVEFFENVETNIPNEKTIVNDYDYSDWKYYNPEEKSAYRK